MWSRPPRGPLWFDFAFREAALATIVPLSGPQPQQHAKASAPRFVTSRHCVNLFFLRQRLCNFAGAFDEELGYRAEGAAFQGHDQRRPPRRGQVDGQRLEGGMSYGEMQQRFREHGEEAPSRGQDTAQMA